MITKAELQSLIYDIGCGYKINDGEDFDIPDACLKATYSESGYTVKMYNIEYDNIIDIYFNKVVKKNKNYIHDHLNEREIVKNNDFEKMAQLISLNGNTVIKDDGKSLITNLTPYQIRLSEKRVTYNLCIKLFEHRVPCFIINSTVPDKRTFNPNTIKVNNDENGYTMKYVFEFTAADENYNKIYNLMKSI